MSGGCLRGRDYLKGRKPFRVTQKMREEVRARVRRALEPREEIALAVLFGSFVSPKLGPIGGVSSLSLVVCIRGRKIEARIAFEAAYGVDPLL